MKRLSIIIANYNYGRFVGAAIDSALALDWPDVEVVVVDDGSTDDSVEIIRSYGDRIRVLETENATQRVAANRGFALSSGDVVVFLDADDMLPPELPGRLAAAWSGSVSKVQFSMQRVDATGRKLGSRFPSYRPVPTSADIRRWVTRTSAYPTPPGSGNAYARWFLDEVMPVGPAAGAAADSALLACAPFFGDVVTVPEIVVLYRRHGGNDSSLLVETSFAREVERARVRWRYARTAAGDTDVDESRLFRSRELLQLRVAALSSDDQVVLGGDSRSRMIADALRSPAQPGPEGVVRRLLVSGWCLLTLAVSRSLASRLVALRYRFAQ